LVSASDPAPPLLPVQHASISIRQVAEVGTLLYTVRAVPTRRGGASINSTFSSVQSDTTFSVDPVSGAIRLLQPVVYTPGSSNILTVVVVVAPSGYPSIYSAFTLSVSIVPVDNTAPVFSTPAYVWTVPALQPIGSTLGTLTATDVGQGAVTYFLKDVALTDIFSVDSTSGAITNKMTLVAGTKYQLSLVAMDTCGYFSTTVALVTVTHVGGPPLLARSTLSFNVTENEPAYTSVGYVSDALSVSGVLESVQAVVTYSLQAVGSSEYFTVVADSGEILTTRILDRDNNNNNSTTYLLDIIVTETYSALSSSDISSTRTATVRVVILVCDMNDNAPQWRAGTQTVVWVAVGQPAGTRVVQVVATDIDEGQNGSIIYSMPSGMYYII